ncbi:hypothetical protein P4C99_10100 [Pontiellaceae bacterium B1224]|nr:hypothetical protein [Pontiellaceae bacterium B1224]
MKLQLTESRKPGKDAFSITPLAILTLVLMVVLGTLVGWFAGRGIAKDVIAADELESSMDDSGDWQEFTVDCDEGFYHVVLNASSALPDGFISLSLNGSPVASAFVPISENPDELQKIVLRNVEFPACSNGTLRASFDEGGMNVDSVEMKTGYESWAEEYAGLPDDPSVDSDSDGVSNLHEYMVGGDPLDAENTGYRPELRDDDQVVYALADDPRIQYEAMASVTSNNVDFNAANTEYVGSKPFGDTMRVHLSVLAEPCEVVTLDLDYIWETPQAN